MRRIAYCLASVTLATLAPPSPPAHARQPSTIVIAVVDDLSRRPLANADIIDLSSGRHRFTDEQGQARLAWPTDGLLRLRVREVGYTPIDRTLRVGQEANDGTATFEMSRIAYVIAPVRSTSRCATDSDSASRLLSVGVLEQLRQGAEKYEYFRRSYPFEATVERRTASVPGSGSVKEIFSEKHRFRSENWEEKYRPGNIVKNARSPDFLVPVLFLSTLADPAFWEHHCFVARGVESLNEFRVVRLEFSASSIRGPDWEGAALLDSATSLLRRVEFRVVNLDPNRGPRRMEGYSTYRAPSPFVVVPDTTVAIWWLRGPKPDGQWGQPDVAQALYLEELKYRKATPPALPQPTATLSSPR